MERPSGAAPRLGEWLSESIALFGQQWRGWIAQGAICFAAVAPFLAGSLGHFLWVFVREVNEAQTGFNPDPQTGVRAIWHAAGIVFAALLPMGLLATFFTAGMFRTAAKQMRGEP